MTDQPKRPRKPNQRDWRIARDAALRAERERAKAAELALVQAAMQHVVAHNPRKVGKP